MVIVMVHHIIKMMNKSILIHKYSLHIITNLDD